MSLLAVERVSARHARADRDAVRDVSLGVQPGEIMALLGPNGSGKSTLLATLAGTLRPRQGRVLLDGEDVRRVSRRRFARRVAHLPQEPTCPEGLSVEALVLSGRHAHVPWLQAPASADREAVRRALSRLSLAEHAHRKVERLSGGERRRAWLAMVLAQESELWLLDEPTAALDLRHQWEVLDIVARECRERGVSVVAALHDVEQVAAVAHRVAVMHRGRLYELGPPERSLRAETLRDVFGVDAELAKHDGALCVRVRGPADPLRSL